MMRIFNILILITFLMLWSCGGSDTKTEPKPVVKKNPNGLSDWEMEHGIGPVKQKITVGEIDMKLVEEGSKIFQVKCTACHHLDDRFIGPALRYVVKRRKPEYIMNMMLNPDEMVRRHPTAQKVLAEYIAPMTSQNLTVEDARKLLEYLRAMAMEGEQKGIPEVPLFKSKQP